MQAEVIEDARVLIENPEHQNFTETNEIIKKGTILNGNPKSIVGKRKGEPFKYKVFFTNDSKLIYIKKIKPMTTTEVQLSAEGDASKIRKISLPTHKSEIYGLVLGAVTGFAYSRYKKLDTKKSVIATVIGAGAGLGIGYFLNKRKATLETTRK